MEDTAQAAYEPQAEPPQEYYSYPQADAPPENYYESANDTATDSLSSLDEIDMELGSLGDYNVDDILREYGFEDD
jgi:hypothetical protein